LVGMAQRRASDRAPALIGYYAGDGAGLEAYHVEQLTHLIWCFGHLQGDTMVVASEQAPIIARMVALKKRNPGMKVLLSFGGWGGCATCSPIFSTGEGRAHFAASVKRLLELHQADGIDLDWEYPAVQGPPGHPFAPTDRHNFTLLVQELRRVLDDRYEISFAAGGTDECLQQGFEWELVMPLVDRVHIMSYDLVHGYSTTTGHHTPLYSSSEGMLSADRAVHLLDRLGVPRAKVVIGSAFYARIFSNVAATNNGLFQPGTFKRTIPFSALENTIVPGEGWWWHRDEAAQAAYAYNGVLREFLTTDDAISVAAKARYVNSEGLGGIMFWQLVDDRKEGGLLGVMYRALRTP
ncbi:MAG TPA: glycosyl hydrolase family 18 protein, partial [Flavobacteriales bacterium]|nr:glycosyl hydrolase family 18 protein [Flavobacteriales bacterium]